MKKEADRGGKIKLTINCVVCVSVNLFEIVSYLFVLPLRLLHMIGWKTRRLLRQGRQWTHRGIDGYTCLHVWE